VEVRLLTWRLPIVPKRPSLLSTYPPLELFVDDHIARSVVHSTTVEESSLKEITPIDYF